MPKRILILHGANHACRLVAVNLQRAGHLTYSALSVEEAEQLLNKQVPDLIVMDPYITIPEDQSIPVDAPGVLLLRSLKDNPQRSEIPIIGLSPHASNPAVFQAIQEGVDVYLKQPFNPMELLPLVERIFGFMA